MKNKNNTYKIPFLFLSYMSYPETKEVEILGQKFVFKRLTAIEDDELGEARQKINQNEVKYLELSKGIISPKLSIEELKQLPRAVVAGLWAEWLQFEKPYYDFLAQLLNSLPPVLQTRATQEQNQTQKTR